MQVINPLTDKHLRKSRKACIRLSSILSTRQERLFDIYIDGGIHKAQYESKMNDMRSKQVDVEQRIANIGTASDEFYENI